MAHLSVGCQFLPIQSRPLVRPAGTPPRIWLDLSSVLPPRSRRSPSSPRLRLLALPSSRQWRICARVHLSPWSICPQPPDPPDTRCWTAEGRHSSATPNLSCNNHER